ncbi:MAG: ABC transporter permease, partial [Blastocatellia bacterium]
ACASLVLALLMLWYKVPVGANLLLLPALLLLTAALALGVGLWLAAWHVKYRDVRYLIPFLIQFWMFATPIIYPASMVPEQYRLLFALNPLTGIIEGYRVALLGELNGARFDWAALGISALITLAVLVYAAYDFRRLESHFADLV